VTILFLTNDLLFSSRVAGAAARAGMTVRTVGSTVALLEQVAAAEAPQFVLLDLNMPGLDPRQLVPALRAASNPPRAVVAYGPHVHEDRLAAATAAGCDEVLTRGQFNARLDDVLTKWRATTNESS
jgi:CheY-like chemotaxis protein